MLNGKIKWKNVVTFIDSLDKSSLVFDCGIGNGKYANHRSDITFIGCDTCLPLLEISSQKCDTLQADGICLPFRNKIFDASISIAVIHHLNSIELRKQFIKELVRVTNGPILFTIWNTKALKETWKPIENEENSYLVPWNNREWRYYHLFTKKDIDDLLSDHKNYICIDEKNNYHITIV